MEEMVNNYEEQVNEVDEIIEETEESTGMSNGAAMLIGGLITAAGFAVVGGIKKLWKNHKAKKAAEAEAAVKEADVATEPEEEAAEA
ncbi:MAG: hypothetical protein IKZ08_02615 [Bacteroidales bacterium]|nr:hypothetical protein [Bacteroidales bacterium]